MSRSFTRRGFLQQSRNALFATGAFSAASALLTACGNTGSASGPVEVTYRFAASTSAIRDYPAVQNAMNKILIPQTGAKIKLLPIDWGSYDQKMKLLFSARQQCDITFSAPWINNYYQLISNGDLQPLDDLFPKDAPQLYSSLTPAMWNAARVQGKIYGVINQQIFVKPWGFQIRKDLADKYHFNLDNVHTWEDLGPIMETIKQDGVIPVSGDMQGSPFVEEYFGWDPVAFGYGVSIHADDKQLKAFANAEQPEYLQKLQLDRKWKQAGYFVKSVVASADMTSQFQAGKYGMLIQQVILPGGNAENKAKYGFDFVSKALAKPILTTGGVTATLNVIGKTSPHPDAALQVLNAINTNKDVYNLLCKGIEGKHWVYTDKAHDVIGFPSGVTAQTSAYNPNSDWMFGDQFNAHYVSEDQVGSWPQTAALNRTATPSVALGFSFIPDNMQTQIAQTNQVSTSYQAAFSDLGQDITGVYNRYVADLKKAGLTDIVAEVQRQLDAWKAHKPQI